MKYPNRLRYYRQKKGYGELQVALYIGLKNENALVKWENGITMPSGDKIVKLTAVYNAKFRQLYPVMWRRAKKEIEANSKKFGLPLRKKPGKQTLG